MSASAFFAVVALVAPEGRPQAHPAPASYQPAFYKDVLPILHQHCQTCHRAGGIGPMPLETYEQARLKSLEIRGEVQTKEMPPWFGDPRYGHFSDDPSLSAAEIQTMVDWVAAGTPAGDPSDAPAPRHWAGGWSIPQPDEVVKMPVAVPIPARGTVDYTYEIVPTGFTEDKWVQMSQVLPSSPEYVHHGVIYIRPPDSKWLRSAPVGVPFTASTLTDPQDRHDAHGTTSDMLLVYAPGSSPDEWQEGMAKFVPAGSDLIFQMHYTTNGHAGSDQSSVGMIFAKQKPAQRVITLQLTNDSFLIPPGADNFPVEVHGSLPNDCLLLSFFPHMHLRGKRFEYNIVHADHSVKTLLLVNYDFHWQLSYRLAQPVPLKAGTELQAIAWFDNSANNPHNPDPNRAVRWGDQTSEEMMVGFFDVAVPADVDKWKFFVRKPAGDAK
ncbi:MAG TPA: hypothetical protein VN862_00605 [Candidatus Acidoferrales bacterium]|nr:hypothetical protein [Candidatus Acidoferrales bacterium]